MPENKGLEILNPLTEPEDLNALAETIELAKAEEEKAKKTDKVSISNKTDSETMTKIRVSGNMFGKQGW